jgi:polyribonucleotide nucleotidyltransferase
MTVISVERALPHNGTQLGFETGKLALQANGSVVGRLGDTMVLVTATAANQVKEGIDFFPLTVDVEERMYAAGKIPGSFFRREGRATDLAILTSRLIDRPLRPSFADGFRNEVHVVATILGVDLANPHDVLAINTASAALMISGLPFEGPVGAVRMALLPDGTWQAFPTYREGDESSFELVVAGRYTSDRSDIAVMMVEAGGTESTWSIFSEGKVVPTEEKVAEGLEAAKEWIRISIELQEELVSKLPEKKVFDWSPVSDYSDEIYARVKEVAYERLVEANLVSGKQARQEAIDQVQSQVLESLSNEFPEKSDQIKAAMRSILKGIVRKRIVDEGVRIDGRDTRTIRPLKVEVGLIPTAHGSGLFQRGETQVLNICTLGMPRMNQQLDSLGIDEQKRYMHHYNMPPFATGEVGFMRGPKRREIGHGLLAERALVPVLPPEDKFGYAMRLVSEVLGSNGSTSMASVCGSTLSLMDAGVPIRAAVGGIAMGLVYENGKYVTLTDILGAEDAFGDMDFKVAGTREFVTALQLDTKIDGIPSEVLAKALEQARQARLEILDTMESVIDRPRDEVAPTAPRILVIDIPIDKIGEVIGPKGKNINALQQETGADVEIVEEGGVGRVIIGSRDLAAAKEAEARILAVLNPPEAKIGEVYDGKVVSITKFGAFVNILPGRDGLIHISKLGKGKRVERVEDVLALNQLVKVRVDDISADNKMALSLVEPEDVTPAKETSGTAKRVSFEDSFESELADQLGELPRIDSPSQSEQRPRR